MEQLKKLQSLCDASNKRYKADQNDDNQVRNLFNYAKKNTFVCVLIGYDTYNAIKADEVIKFYKENPEAEIKIENDFCYLKMNNSTVCILYKLLN